MTLDYFLARRYLDTLPDWETERVDLGPLENYLPRMRCLLSRLGDPQDFFRSIIIGGTNGKGSVASLLADLLQAAGHSVGLYTSPHLHTLRERIRINGQLPTKDMWAVATDLLYDKTRDFEGAGYGTFSKYEAVTALAAHMFHHAEVQFGVFEVGLGGRCDAVNAWDSELALLTPIGLDHCDILGDRLEQIAAEKAEIARRGKVLLTTATQPTEVGDFLGAFAVERGVDLRLINSLPFAAGEIPSAPETLAENAGLALAAAELLLGGEMGADKAAATVREHHWPGRFERVQQQPLIILDGAHSPSATAALAKDLGQLAAKWHFVVGVNAGHDAGGILEALEPLAQRVTLTSSDHPKAIDATALVARAPSGLRVSVEPVNRRAFRKSVERLEGDEALCVLGSLHLVARAREFFNLPYEREGISEDVALESLECVEIACANRGIECERITGNENVLRVTSDGRSRYFMRNKHPFNDYVAARLAEDKGYQYELFSQANLPMPLTIQVFNPLADARFDRYKTHRSIQEVCDDIQRQFDFPLVLKKYRSSISQGVYLERNTRALSRRLRDLFEHSAFSDNILLVQTYVEGPEYRVVASQGELLLAYEKQSDGRAEGEDLNPLHQSNGRAVKLEDGGLLESMQGLLEVIATVVDLGLYAVDVIQSLEGPQILEINPNPFCYFYNKDNGREDFVAIYEKLIAKYLESPVTSGDIAGLETALDLP